MPASSADLRRKGALLPEAGEPFLENRVASTNILALAPELGDPIPNTFLAPYHEAICEIPQSFSIQSLSGKTLTFLLAKDSF